MTKSARSSPPVTCSSIRKRVSAAAEQSRGGGLPEMRQNRLPGRIFLRRVITYPISVLHEQCSEEISYPGAPWFERLHVRRRGRHTTRSRSSPRGIILVDRLRTVG